MQNKIVVIDLQLTECIESMFKEYMEKKPRMIVDHENVVFGVTKKPNVVMNRKMALDTVCRLIIESGTEGVITEDAVSKLEDCKFANRSSTLSSISRYFKDNFQEWKLKKTKNKLFAIRII